MLTPEQLNLFEFNDVVKLYNQLSIDIVADIIERVSQFQEITNTTKYQLQVLKQTNGTEIFNSALEKTSFLTADTKKALKALYEEVAKTDIQSYKDLYDYQGKTYKLSESQYKIINQGLKTTNRTLKNLTNTIAFSSQQAYVNAVDSAYLKAVSGAFSYTSAIDTTVQELANQGLTLKDSLGRNVQLEVAVRRNILAGIRDTARALDKDISDYLGCDGYEVTAHIGARPTHAEAQGKQYAITREKAKEFGVGLWSDVADLWSEYNCRHDYFGIILGISEPTYTNEELAEMKNATVTLNGEEVAYYEATQKQRALENNIRKTKRAISSLEQAGQDATTQRVQLQNLQKQYNSLCNETGLSLEYNRLKVSSNDSTTSIKSDIIKLPNYENAVIAKEKFTEYALNPEKDLNKSIAFEKALGYNLTNVDKLIKNIYNNLDKYEAIEKGDNGFGEKYEVLMTLVGENKKVANVKTAWIVDKDTGETRLTSAYVTSKGWKKEDQ